MGHEVALEEMLAARERRADRQQQMIRRTGWPVICFMLNIPGPVKTSDMLRRAFEIGVQRIREQLRAADIPFREDQVCMEKTGYEYYVAADCAAGKLKWLMVRIEEADQLGRLFDIDVLGMNGKKLNRVTPRACLICGNEAHACARSRAHSLDALHQAVQSILCGIA